MDMRKILVSTKASTWVGSDNISVKVSTVGLSSSNPATSPDSLSTLGRTEGTYWLKSPSMSSSRQMYYAPNMADGKSWVKVFSSPYSSTATINEIGNSIDFEGFLVQRNDAASRAYSYFGAKQLYNTRSSTDLTSGGTKSGFRVYLGQAGGHGFYNTAQSPCSWGDSNGAVGAGWNGSTCGSFPNGLIWGTGQSGTANYTNLSGTWEHWIWWS